MDLNIRKAECEACAVGDILYIKITKTKVTPQQMIEILNRKHCTKVCFNNSKKIYKLEDIKGKESWTDVK